MFLLITILTFLVFKPFLASLAGGFLLAYLLWPLHKRLVKVVKSKTISAVILGILAVAVLAIPIVLITLNVLDQATVFVTDVKARISSNGYLINCDESDIICSSILEFARQETAQGEIKASLEQLRKKGLEYLASFVKSIPSLMLGVFILLFTTYYGLKEGDRIVKTSTAMIPLTPKFKEIVIERTKTMIDGTIYGSLVIALIQGIVASIGFYIFGVKTPILWGFLTGIAALIPVAGTALIWIPIGSYFIITAIITSNLALNPFAHFMGTQDPLGQGIAIFLWGTLLVGTIDNFLRPKIVGNKTQLHPILILVGVLGGIKFFGFTGIVLGPLVIALFITFIHVFLEEKNELVS